MKQIKGFVLAECMLSLIITILGLSIFALVLNENHKLAIKKEQATDIALAHHIMRATKTKEIIIHDRIYKANEEYAAEN